MLTSYVYFLIVSKELSVRRIEQGVPVSTNVFSNNFGYFISSTYFYVIC